MELTVVSSAEAAVGPSPSAKRSSNAQLFGWNAQLFWVEKRRRLFTKLVSSFASTMWVGDTGHRLSKKSPAYILPRLQHYVCSAAQLTKAHHVTQHTKRITSR